MKYYNCVVCSKRTKPKERKSINPHVERYLRNKLFLQNITPSHIICNKCMHKYYTSESKPRNIEKSLDDPLDPDYIPPKLARPTHQFPSPPSVTLSIPGASKSHARCFVCKKPGPKLVVLCHDARYKAFIDANILIPAGARCCPVHVDDKYLKIECYGIIPTSETSSLNSSSIMKLLSHLRETSLKAQNGINFDNIQDIDCKNLTGLTKYQFEDVCSHIVINIKNTPSRTPKVSVGLFLTKMKCALSNKLLSTLFKISISSVRRAIHTVRKAFMRSFVPLYLGLESITREDIINKHTRPLAKSLLEVENDNLILVLDGTYIYIQKSNNFAFQRRSFSVHKSRPLVKPMVVVTTSGYFVTILGPYLARNNDASILNHMLKCNLEEIKDFIKENDVFVVDRGFRDSLELLEDLGIKAAMPAFIEKGQKQMTDTDANASRMVTKIRWVVESANARIKSYKFLDRVLPTNQVPHIGDYVRIVCAIANKYFPPLSQTKNPEDDEILAREMQQKLNEINSLKKYVEDNNLARGKAKWTSIEDSSISFPNLTEEQLRSITCGIYQLKLCPSYIQEYVEGDSEILIHKEETNLIRVRIQSRHVSSKTYLIWIKFSTDNVDSWYCTCRAGARVVGVCAHIAAIVWYLSRTRGANDKFGVQDWGAYLKDASVLPESIDSSDSETESVCSVIEE